MTLDDVAAKARERTTDRQKEMANRMQKMMKERKARFEEMDKSGGEIRAARETKVLFRCFFGAVALASKARGGSGAARESELKE